MPLLTPESHNSSWQIFVQPGVAVAASAAARDIANRLRDEERLKSAAQLAVQQSNFPGLTRGLPESMSNGNAGLALLCSYLDACFPEER